MNTNFKWKNTLVVARDGAGSIVVGYPVKKGSEGETLLLVAACGLRICPHMSNDLPISCGYWLSDKEMETAFAVTEAGINAFPGTTHTVLTDNVRLVSVLTYSDLVESNLQWPAWLLESTGMPKVAATKPLTERIKDAQRGDLLGFGGLLGLDLAVPTTEMAPFPKMHTINLPSQIASTADNEALLAELAAPIPVPAQEWLDLQKLTDKERDDVWRALIRWSADVETRNMDEQCAAALEKFADLRRKLRDM